MNWLMFITTISCFIGLVLGIENARVELLFIKIMAILCILFSILSIVKIGDKNERRNNST